MKNREQFLERIVKTIGDIDPDSEAYLYGSHARGDAKSLSDWDLLILLSQPKVSFEIETRYMDELYEIELETGEIISPLIYSQQDWVNNHSITPLYENIEKEGIKIK
jgi:predicted nucleotidyltransferase